MWLIKELPYRLQVNAAGEFYIGGCLGDME